MKKIRFLLLALVGLLGGVTAQAADVTVYIDPVGDGTWLANNAKISVNVYTDGQSNNTFVTPTTYEGDVLKVTFADSYNRMIIVRGENQDAWGWNQTENITPVDNTLYKANGYTGDNLAYTTVNPYVTAPSAGYVCDFNTAITTSNHDFKVAKGWEHIVGVYKDSYADGYMNYSYGSDTGVDGSGALLAYKQYAQNVYNDGEVCYDLLVTPLVNGAITLDVKACSSAGSSYNAFVEVYAINADGTRGALLKTIKEDIAGYNSGSNTEWATFTLAELTEEQKLGLRCQYVYIDNFKATSVNIPLENKLEVTSVANKDGQTGTSGTNPQFEQQADGNMKVQLKVTLSNTGDYDFVAGTTTNYTLTPAQAASASGTKTYYDNATIAIPEDLAVGETKTFDVEFAVPYVSGYKYWFVRENVSGTTSSSCRYATAVAYESKFVFREAGSNSTSDLTTTQDYGRVSSATTRSFEIYNDGTAPLTIISIALPEGFTSDNLPEIPAEGLELAKKTATAAFNVTLPVDVMGDFSGNLVIEYVKAGDTEATQKTLTFKGTVLQEGIWFADFNGNGSTNDGVYPTGSVVTSSTALQFGYTGAYGSYDNYLKSYSSAGMLVMPKLTATAGAQLKYDAVRYQSGNSYTLKVYVSTDRNSLGEAKATINNNDLETSGERYTQTLTFDQAGDYYVAFELYGVGLDNVIGLTKTEVTHDLYFKETNLITEAQTGKEIKPNVKVIPLTNETADGYTVKYYVDNEAVAEGTAIALTSSATADKTFTIAYTPTDEVTTEHDTYIEFEFADGTKIATEHQTLKVTNEPKFLFVAANTSVSQYTTNLTTAQAFGKVNVTTESKSFKIYNQGTATLQVTNIAAPEGFSVNKTEAFEVAAGASEDIIVTFDAATPGEYAGNLVVTYVQDGAEPYQLAFSGIMLDNSKWYANFNNPTTSAIVWPAGSLYESSVNTSYSGWSAPYNYYIYSRSATNNKFTTPKLTAAAGDVFSFDAKAYNSNGGSVKVYASAKRDELGEPIVNLALTNTDWATQNVTITNAGDNYITIEFQDAYLDELYGLTLADVAHDWMIASSNIPAEAMQNVASTATVNILNLGLKDEAAEDITVTAYVNGEAVATGEGTAIPMSHQLSAAGTQLSVSYLVNTVGTFPVYLEVKAGDYSVQTDPVNVTFAEEEAMAGVQVGTKSTTSSNVPFYTTWMDDGAGKSMADFIYTPEQLAAFGISAGSKIKSISFVGSPTGTKTISSLTTDAWIAQQAVSDFTAGSPSTDDMIHVNIHNAESVSFTNGTAYEFKIDLSESPIVYDGTSGIRIYTNINGNGQYQSINFDVDNNYQNAYYAHGTGSFSSKTGNPVAYFELEASVATLSGTVTTSANAGIAGATVTLKAENGVQYAGTTDESGAYSINVIQAGLNFTVSVEAADFLKKEFALNMNGESMTQPVVLFKQFGLVGTMPGFNGWDNDMVMTQSTDNTNIFTLEMNDVEVTAGTYAFKLRADGAWDLPSGYYKPNFDNGTENGYTVSGGNYQWNFETSGTYNFLFTFDLSTSTLTFERPFLLAENAEGVADLNWVDVTVEREFKAGWNAVVLPFAMTAAEVTEAFGENSELAVYDGDEGTGSVTVKFKKIENDDKFISAGYPYMLWLEAPVSGLKFTKNISSTLTTAPGTNFDFVGVYATTNVDAGDYFVAGGVFKRATTNNTVKPFRAYLKAKTAGVRSINFVVNDGGISTAIDNLEIEGLNNAEGAYNLSGQKVQTLNRKGLYIINGKKVYVK